MIKPECHTVHARHRQAIFDKVGVRSRRELVGQVFAQHHQPRMATGHEPDADGSFDNLL